MYKKILKEMQKQKRAEKEELAKNAANNWPFDPKAISQKNQKGSGQSYSDQIRELAGKYAKTKGLQLKHPTQPPINQERAAHIASAYENMKHDPEHPEVKSSYNALIGETSDQFDFIKNNTKMKFSKIKPGMDSPYKNSKDLAEDVRHNNHMWYYPTEQGYGNDKNAPKNHPMLTPTSHLDSEGNPMLANDVFRIVHDYFGHAKEGNKFGSKGEEGAWLNHQQMYTPAAHKALTTETRGQNSWVNYGPHGERNRNNPQNTIYSEQKAGILPDWAHTPHASKETLKLTKIEELMFKAENCAKGNCSVRNRKPHFIFSAENPRYSENKKLNLSHNDVLDFLKRKGYDADDIKGKYGDEERAIIVHNPSKHSIKHLFKLAANLGQESSIYSNGYDHELHYHGGPNASKHNKGQGTNFHKQVPKDFYSTLSDGTTFTHNIDSDNFHDSDSSLVKRKDETLKKSEEKYGIIYLCKNEKKDDDHPLASGNSGLNLIHYSPQEGLDTLDSSYQGVRGIGAESKRAQPEHPTTFFYLEGTKPEDIVAGGAKHKYIVPMQDKKVYDLAKDPEGIYAKAREQASSRQINPGVVQRRDVDKLIQERGYHGFYNSSLNDTMKNVVALYGRIKPTASYKLHEKDLKEASAQDYHGEGDSRRKSKRFASMYGHHNPSFLYKLSKIFKK